jgi:hypothetical protein
LRARAASAESRPQRMLGAGLRHADGAITLRRPLQVVSDAFFSPANALSFRLHRPVGDTLRSMTIFHCLPGSITSICSSYEIEARMYNCKFASCDSDRT